MDTKRGPDAQDQAPRPDDESTGKPRSREGTATNSPKREDGARAVEVEDLNSANDEGAD